MIHPCDHPEFERSARGLLNGGMKSHVVTLLEIATVIVFVFTFTRFLPQTTVSSAHNYN